MGKVINIDASERSLGGAPGNVDQGDCEGPVFDKREVSQVIGGINNKS